MVHGCAGSNVDEDAALLLEHLRHNGARYRIARAQIRRQHLFEDTGILFPKLAAAGEGSNRVHHDVKAAVLCDNGLDELFHRDVIGYVNLLPAKRSNGRDALQLVEFARLAVGDHNLGALFEEGEADGASQGASAAGDQDQLPGEWRVHSDLAIVNASRNKRRPSHVLQAVAALLKFFFLTFAVSWAFFVAGAAGAGAFGHPVPLLAALQGVLFFIGTITPALVALWLTARTEGGLGTQTLLGRVLQWDVAGRWYIFAISYMAVIKLA